MNLNYEIQKLRKDKKKAESKGDWKDYAGICNYLGQLLSKNGDYEGALAEHKLEKKICTSLKDTIGVAIAHRRIGECYCELGLFSPALSNHQQHLKLAQESGSDIEEQRAWATIGRTFYLKYLEEIQADENSSASSSSLNKAQKAYLKALEMCEKLDAQVSHKELMQMKCRLMLNLGLVFNYRGQLSKCAEFIEQAIVVNRKNDLFEELQRCYYLMATIYQQHEKYPESIKYIDRSLLCCEKLKDKPALLESLLCKAEILIMMSNFAGAKSFLKKAFRMKSIVAEDFQKIEKKLKVVVKLCQFEAKLLEIGDESSDEKMKLFEYFGDGCAHLGNYARAIDFYHRMLREAENLGKSSEEKIPIYISLAQTYSDNKQYVEALKYFQLELECVQMTDSHEVSKTLLNMAVTADCSERMDDDALKFYQRAYQSSVDAANVTMQYKCLKALVSFHKKHGNSKEVSENENQMETLKQAKGLDSDLDDSEPEEGDSQDVFLNVNITDVSDTSDSDNDEDRENYLRTRRRKKQIGTKVNEVGETSLHRACIEGKLTAVKQLMKKGHPVNVRDYCGWLPIHEAVNHGFIDIVEELIFNGASVNDRGGQQCEGITPLHDAASGGHMDIMRLLIRHGASVVSLTDKGENPLDFLIQWRERCESDLDDETRNDGFSLENELRESMKKVGQETCNDANNSVGDKRQKFSSIISELCSSSDDELPVKRRRKSSYSGQNDQITNQSLRTETIKEKSVQKNESDSENDPSDSVGLSTSNSADEEENLESGAKAYEQAISLVRRSAKSSQNNTKPINVKSKETDHPALISEEDHVGQDWLIDESEIPTSSKKQQYYGPANIFSSSNTWNVKSHSYMHKRASCSESEENKRTKESNSFRQRRNHENSNLNVHESSVITTSPVHSGQNASSVVTTVPSVKIPLPDQSPFVDSSTSMPPIRVKVKILGKLLLIPVPSGDKYNVSWLALEASSRYYALTGLRPVVTLSNSDGALLCASDNVAHVVMPGEEITGNVDSWDLPPLPDRYKTACTALGNFMYSNVKTALQKCQTSDELNLSDLSLGTMNVRPVFRAIQHHNFLKSLIIDSNRIGDDGISYLVEALPSLPSVTKLNISSNNLTSRGIQSLADKISASENPPLQMLNILDLSNNPLGDLSSCSIGKILSTLTNLSKLNVASCELTAKALQQPTSSLNTAFEGSRSLTCLNVGYNNLQATGLDLLFRCLRSDVVLSLDISSTVMTKFSPHVSHIIEKYIADPNCTLEELILAECMLSDEDVIILTSKIKSAKRLSNLSLAGNNGITFESISRLLNDVRVNGVPLVNLDLSGCPSMLASSSQVQSQEIIKQFSDILEQNNTLKDLRLSVDDAHSDLIRPLQDAWLSNWGQVASFKYGPGSILHFSVYR